MLGRPSRSSSASQPGWSAGDVLAQRLVLVEQLGPGDFQAGVGEDRTARAVLPLWAVIVLEDRGMGVVVAQKIGRAFPRSRRTSRPRGGTRAALLPSRSCGPRRFARRTAPVPTQSSRTATAMSVARRGFRPLKAGALDHVRPRAGAGPQPTRRSSMRSPSRQQPRIDGCCAWPGG